MPHCVIEHSSNIDSDLLVQTVYSAALSSELFEPDGSDIKVRALAYTSYMTGPVKADFIHVALKILSGRDDEQKSNLASTVTSGLVSLELIDVSITVEVVDMDRESYRKVI